MWHILNIFGYADSKNNDVYFFLGVSTDYYATFVLGNHTASQLCVLPVFQAVPLVFIVNLTDFYAEESKNGINTGALFH